MSGAKRINVALDGVATTNDVVELRGEIAELRSAVEKLLTKLTAGRGDKRQLRTDLDRKRAAFKMRQSRIAAKLGYSVDEFRAIHGNVDRLPLGAPSATSKKAGHGE